MASVNETQNHSIPIQTESKFNEEGETPPGNVTGEINAPLNSENRLIGLPSGSQDQEIQNMGEEPLQGDEEDQQFDPNHLRVSIKSTDMSENMVLFVVEKTILAFEAAAYSLETQKEGSKLDHNTLIAKFIKGEMELFYKPTWHVIVGGNYGGFFTHEEFNSVVFCMNDKWITIFKSNVPQKE